MVYRMELILDLRRLPFATVTAMIYISTQASVITNGRMDLLVPTIQLRLPDYTRFLLMMVVMFLPMKSMSLCLMFPSLFPWEVILTYVPVMKLFTRLIRTWVSFIGRIVPQILIISLTSRVIMNLSSATYAVSIQMILK